MKNKFTSGLCVMMCLVLVLSMFAACSIKDKNTDNTTTTLSPDNQWYVGNGTYEPVVLDGFELADLVMICEEKFGITIEDEDIRKFTTVGDVVTYLENNQ